MKVVDDDSISSMTFGVKNLLRFLLKEDNIFFIIYNLIWVIVIEKRIIN